MMSSFEGRNWRREPLVPWTGEDARMSLFDAAVIGLTLLVRSAPSREILLPALGPPRPMMALSETNRKTTITFSKWISFAFWQTFLLHLVFLELKVICLFG
jgi:hypothetical protein